MQEIILPGGYAPEDGKGPGDEVQALVTMKLNPDGTKAYLIAVDGAKYEKVEEKEEYSKGNGEEVVEEKVEEGTSTEDFSAQLEKAMGGMM